MNGNNVYDVTKWRAGNPYEDIGEVINSILADVKSRQTAADVNEGGKPGAVIYLPPGDYHLKTQVVIDISYLKIAGSGHGFTSSSIRLPRALAGRKPRPCRSAACAGGGRGKRSRVLCQPERKSADQFGGVFGLLHRRSAFYG